MALFRGAPSPSVPPPQAPQTRVAETHRLLEETFVGPLDQPADVEPGSRPALVARAVNTADVRTALVAAGRTGVPLTVRGAGHGHTAPHRERLHP